MVNLIIVKCICAERFSLSTDGEQHEAMGIMQAYVQRLLFVRQVNRREMWNDDRPDMTNTIISWWTTHWIRIFVFLLPLVETEQLFENVLKKKRERKEQKPKMQENLWFQLKWSTGSYFAIGIVVRYVKRGLNGFDCAFRSDEMVHHTFWRVEVIVTGSFPSFPLSLGNIAVHLNPVWIDLWLQFHQRSMKPLIPTTHTPSSAAKPDEIKNTEWQICDENECQAYFHVPCKEDLCVCVCLCVCVYMYVYRKKPYN